MSEQDPELDEPAFDDTYAGGGRRKKGRGVPGCIAVIVALVIVLGGVYFVVTKGVDALKAQFGSAADYAGPGRGRVTFEVHEGDTSTVIGRNLKAEGVVESVQAFTDAASGNPDSRNIQVGFYQLKKEMKASDALDILVDPGNILSNTVTIPEGLRVVDIVDILAAKTDFKKQAFLQVLADPSQLGLPSYANGNPEGYLFPSTYSFGPNMKPLDMLKAMVTRWEQAASDADLEGAATALGYTPGELMTVASLVESEARRAQDRGKVARVIYNRLENPDNGQTNGLLQIDATVNYALDRKLGVGLTLDDLQVDSPYNTYKNPGLPPTPIEAPGDAAIQAAAHPTDGPWLYYVTVNLRTGETKFTDNYDEFLAFKDELGVYCQTSDAC
ncbi:endolytic transglycosylase MltG [Nocardioides sp.]|uniref:endolytic transglycosylase MltG n=1 Tax=Nocardioides sp. TaxID=35761 RepID=UPI0031FF27D0|nr:mltG [Nocardioides sp.]